MPVFRGSPRRTPDLKAHTPFGIRASAFGVEEKGRYSDIRTSANGDDA